MGRNLVRIAPHGADTQGMAAAGGGEAAVNRALQRLLRRLVENGAALAAGDTPLHGQLSAAAALLSQPCDLAAIERAELHLNDVIARQSTLHHNLGDTKTAFREMVSGFVLRLAAFSESADSYQDRIESLAVQIRRTDDMATLDALLAQVAEATRAVREVTGRSREETIDTHRKAQAAEQRIRDLELALEQVSAKVREDQLTGVLNRRGLEEEYARAVAISERRREPLSVAVLDIDDFKLLNDTYGHQAGDGVLAHVARVMKATVRPSDAVCRYGGEEFVILLSGTGTDNALTAIGRVQRELLRRAFAQGDQRVLVTFSAGVAERRTGEEREAVIARADGAMYQAKRAGKNRVLPAE